MVRENECYPSLLKAPGGHMHDTTGDGANALQLTLHIDDQNSEAEIWRARIPGEGPSDARVGAEARIHRVHYANPLWLTQLQTGDPELATVGSAFVDRELISLLDESSLFTECLSLISFVRFGASAQDAALAHTLVRGIARVFDGDSIALMMTGPVAADGVDAVAQRRAHWAEIGFVEIPGTTSMLLPMGARS